MFSAPLKLRYINHCVSLLLAIPWIQTGSRAADASICLVLPCALAVAIVVAATSMNIQWRKQSQDGVSDSAH